VYEVSDSDLELPTLEERAAGPTSPAQRGAWKLHLLLKSRWAAWSTGRAACEQFILAEVRS